MKRTFNTFKKKLLNLVDEYEPVFKKRKIDENSSPASSTTERLKPELTCPVNMDIFIYPITLECGHTFEAKILNIMDNKQMYECPTCRKTHIAIEGRIEPNYAIMNIIDTLYPEYRKNHLKEHTKPKPKEHPHVGTQLLLKLKAKNLIQFEKYFKNIKEQLDESIKYGGKPSGWFNQGCINTTFYSLDNKGILVPFMIYLQKKGILIEIFRTRSKRQRINCVKYTLVSK